MSGWNKTCADVEMGRLQTETDCIEASELLGFTYKGKYSFPEYPSGCFSNRFNHAYWNTHGKGARYKDSQGVCQYGKQYIIHFVLI